MQPFEFFNYQSLHCGLLICGNASRYGVSYPAAMFLVAQTLALGAQEPQYMDHSPNERT